MYILTVTFRQLHRNSLYIYIFPSFLKKKSCRPIVSKKNGRRKKIYKIGSGDPKTTDVLVLKILIIFRAYIKERIWELFLSGMHSKNLLLFSSSSILILLLVFSSISVLMAEDAVPKTDGSPAVHIVYTEKPEGEDPEAYHIRTLASVLGRFNIFIAVSLFLSLFGLHNLLILYIMVPVLYYLYTESMGALSLFSGNTMRSVKRVVNYMVILFLQR